MAYRRTLLPFRKGPIVRVDATETILAVDTASELGQLTIACQRHLLICLGPRPAVKRFPGRWLLLGLCTVTAGVGIGLALAGAPLPWSSGGRTLP
jgi:hypothetical protein